MQPNKICPRCRAEYAPNAEVCPDCDEALVAAGVASPARPSEAEAHLLVRESAIGYLRELSRELEKDGIHSIIVCHSPGGT